MVSGSNAELELVNTVDLRFALTETEPQLETSLNQLLAPLLLKLSSKDAQVRQAVFKVIQNVFPRITAAPSLQLPIEALLSQIKNPNVPVGTDSSTVMVYSLLFLSKGVERLSPEAQCRLVPEMVKGISRLPTTAAARMFSIVVKALTHWKSPSGDSIEYENMSETLGFVANRTDERFFAEKAAKFLLLLPTASSAPTALPGLTIGDVSFFTKDAGITYSTQQELVSAKIRILEFLKAGFSDQCLIFPLLVASVDSLSIIADAAETRFRKLTINYDDEPLVSRLVNLYLGTTCPAVKPTLQEKLVAFLIKFPAELYSSRITEIADVGLDSEYVRLRLTIIRLIKQTTRNSNPSTESQEKQCTQIASKLKMNILSDGWPQLDSTRVTNYRKAIEQRELQYETLGDLLCNSISFLESNLDYFQFMFDSLDTESAELRSVLQVALSRLLVHLPKLSKESKEALLPLLRSIIETENTRPASKFIALKYVNMAFPFSDVEARYLCVLGLNTNNTSEIIEESKKGLDPYQFSFLLAISAALEFESPNRALSGEDFAMPLFEDFTSFLINETLCSQSTLSNKNSLNCMSEAILFAFRMLVMRAIKSHKTIVAADEHWHTRLDEAVSLDEKVRGLLSEEINRLSNTDLQMTDDDAPKNSFQTFISMTFEALKDQFFSFQSISPNSVLTTVFYSLVKSSPDSIISGLTPLLPDILSILEKSTLSNIYLHNLAKCFAIIGTHENVSITYIYEVCLALKESSGSPTQKGKYFFVAAAIFSRLALRNRLKEINSDSIISFLEEIVEALKLPQLYDSCLTSISELAIYGVIGPNSTTTAQEKIDVIRVTFYEAILPRAKSCHELSLLTISKLSLATKEIYETNITGLLPIESVVFDTHIAKNIEFAFVGGECLLILAGGWQSKLLLQYLDVAGKTPVLMPNLTGQFEVIISEILNSSRMSKPALKKASCLWLLAIVQYLGHKPELKEKLAEIHAAFMRFLSDRDEIIQECASRGLSLTYDLGNVDLKETLVKGLIKSFTDTSGNVSFSSGSVHAETQLFDNDTLRTHDGSVSTYKDVLSLASDVGDPSLVYKFMSLAKANASWTSKRGMAFGLGKILSKSSLDNLLSHDSKLTLRLVPKLFRYRFDANKLVSHSMNDIWTALFPDSSLIVKSNFKSIMVEVLNGMGNREWRVRQASISALENLLQILAFESYEAQIQDIWSMTFRCMDDIKETVRKEAQTLAKTMARTLVRNADVSTGNCSVNKAIKLIEEIIPFLLGNKGLLSDAEDVRHFALETILKICETGGEAITPFIPKLITTFIELMSSLEPEIVNYLVLNADKFNLSGNEVDAKRVQSLGSSPLLEAIDKLIGHIDETLMKELVLRLRTSIKKSVGLPSKACGSRVIVILVSKMPIYAKPYGNDLLKICLENLNDKNLTIATSFAVSAGYCCKLASIDAIVNYSQDLNRLYFDSGDVKSRFVAALASNSVSKFAGIDKFEAVASAFLPLAFIGKHDEDKDILKLFETEWIDSASGNSAIRLYFQEIRAMCESQIKCSDYNVRRVIARSLKEISSLRDVFSEKETEELIQLLLLGCKDKSWLGKETVFDALVDFSIKSSAFLELHSELMSAIVNTVRVEANRRNKAYQVHAVQTLSKFINTFNQIPELIDQYLDIMSMVFCDEYLEEVDLLDEDRKTEKALKSQHSVAIEEVYLKLIENIGASIAPGTINHDLLKFLLDAMNKFVASGHELSWRTCVSYNEIVKSILQERSDADFDVTSVDTLYEIFELLLKFKDQYKLEKSLVLLARNSVLGLIIFDKCGKKEYSGAIRTQLISFRQNGHSSVAAAEIDKALALN